VEEFIEAYDDNEAVKSIFEDLLKALNTVKRDLEARLESMEDIIDSDVELAIQESRKYAKGDIKPIVLVKHPDIAPLIAKKLTSKERTMVEFDEIEVEVIVGDMDVLAKVDENSTEHQRAASEVDFERMVREIAEELKGVLAEFEDDPTEKEVLEDKMEDVIRKKIKEGVKRGVDELSRLADVRTSYRKYKIKASVELTLNVAGILASVAGTAMAPITGGATVIIGMMGLFKSAVNLGKQIGKLSLEAEGMITRVTKNLKTLNTRYQEGSSTRVGMGEMGATFLNSLVGDVMDTIKEVSSDCDNIEDKVNGLEVKAGKMSARLDKLLNGQEDYMRALNTIKVEEIEDTELKAKVKSLKSEIDGIGDKIDDMINDVQNLNERVNDGRKEHKKLDKMVSVLVKREPTWAKVGTTLLSTAVGVAFITAGNVGGPDAYSFVGVGKDIVDGVGTALDVFGEAKTLVEDAAELIEE
ncbi:MAG: hypothetical protein AAFV80_18030, partial [Bacteroidota bacterium]